MNASGSARSAAGPAAVWPLLVDLSEHLEWGGRRYHGKGEYLLELTAAPGPATVGTEFSSSGHAHEGRYDDHSLVTLVDPPSGLEFITIGDFRGPMGASRITSRHHWTVTPDGTGSIITHRTTILGNVGGARIWRALYAFPPSRFILGRLARGLLRGGAENLAVLAEERAGLRPPKAGA
jgi:hypothetical protein